MCVIQKPHSLTKTENVECIMRARGNVHLSPSNRFLSTTLPGTPTRNALLFAPENRAGQKPELINYDEKIVADNSRCASEQTRFQCSPKKGARAIILLREKRI